MHSLYKLRIPDPIIFSFITAWRFLPVFIRNYNQISNSLKLRGWSMKTSNPIIRVKKVFHLLYPVTYSAIPIFNDLTLAVKTRGFGTAKINPKPMPFLIYDRIIIITSILMDAVIIYGVYKWNWGLI